MASWNAWKLTQKGQQFQAKVNAGLVDEVTYTKFALGSGIASTSLESLTELVHKELDLPLKSVKPQNNAVTFNTLILNNDVEADFYCREMGLYVTDPDDGEILYAVSTDNNPDLMPAAGGATVVAYDFTLVLIFSNTGNIVSYVNMQSLATMQDIENHNTDTEAHKDFVGATAAEAGVRGMVPAPEAGNTNRYLNSAGEWALIETMKGATETQAGSEGLMPAPPAGAQNKVLTGGNLWTLIEELNVELGNIAVPTADTTALKTLLGGMAYMFKTITGQNDWKIPPTASIAAILSSLSDNLAVNWDGDKFTVPALGISGLMAQNGYVNLGKLFGGLIVQWINNTGSSGWGVVNYPVTIAETFFIIPVTISDGHADRTTLFKYYPLVSTYDTTSADCWLEGNNQFILVVGR